MGAILISTATTACSWTANRGADLTAPVGERVCNPSAVPPLVDAVAAAALPLTVGGGGLLLDYHAEQSGPTNDALATSKGLGGAGRYWTPTGVLVGVVGALVLASSSEEGAQAQTACRRIHVENAAAWDAWRQSEARAHIQRARFDSLMAAGLSAAEAKRRVEGSR